MNSIDIHAMERVAEWVNQQGWGTDWHTVTVVLNGQHGGVDVTMIGTNPRFDEVTVKAVMK